MITHEVVLNLDGVEDKNLYAMQGDYNSTYVLCHLVSGGKPLDLTDCEISVLATKPDRTFIVNECTIEKAKEGECSFQLTKQFLATCGRVKTCISVKHRDSKLSSFPFTINVTRSVVSVEAVVSSNEFNVLDKYFQKITDGLDMFNAEVKNIDKEERQRMIQERDRVKNEAIRQQLADNLNSLSYQVQAIIENPPLKDMRELQRNLDNALDELHKYQASGGTPSHDAYLTDLRIPGKVSVTRELSGVAVNNDYVHKSLELLDNGLAKYNGKELAFKQDIAYKEMYGEDKIENNYVIVERQAKALNITNESGHKTLELKDDGNLAYGGNALALSGKPAFTTTQSISQSHGIVTIPHRLGRVPIFTMSTTLGNVNPTITVDETNIKLCNYSSNTCKIVVNCY